MSKEIIEHRDIFERVITEGCNIAYSYGTGIAIGTVGKCTPKMVKCFPIKHPKSKGQLKYPHEVLVVDGSDVTFYVLKHTKA